MKNNLLTIIIVFLSSFALHTQTISKRTPSKSLDERIESIKHFPTIQKLANAYYDSIRRNLIKLHPNDRSEKHWRRYEWFTQNHLDENNEITNYTLRNLEGEEEAIRMQVSNDRSTHSHWVFNGPSNHVATPTTYQYIGKGRTDRIAFHPTNPNIVLVGTPAGGLWRSTDGGNTFFCTTNNFPNLGISGIAFAKSNPNVVYMLTGCAVSGGAYFSAGIYKSYDAGYTWVPTTMPTTANFSGYEISVSDINENFVYAATTIGMIASHDGGTTWTILPGSYTFYDVKHKPGSNIVYGVTATNFVKYHDTGTFPVPTTSQFIASNGRKGIAVSAADPNRVYVLSGPTTGVGTFNGFFMSNNSGVSFTTQSTTPNVFGGEGGADNFHQSWYDFCVTASPTNANLVVMGGLVVNKSLNSGVNWTSITTYGAGSSSPNYVHPDIHDVEFNPHNGDLYTANDGGLYRSSDQGVTWTNLSSSIHTTQFYHIDGYKNNLNYFVGGTQDNGTKFRSTNSLLMDHVAGTDGFQAVFYENDSTKFYCSFNGNVRRFYNSGVNSDDISPSNNWFHKIAVHVTDPNIVFVGDTALYVSTNQGTSYTTYASYPANQSIEVSRSNPNKFYVSGITANGTHKMHRLTALGAVFTRIDLSTGFPTSDNITDISVHPLLENFVYITVGGYNPSEKVYFSSNGGDSWVNHTYNLPNIPILCIEVSSNNDVYIGTDIGVFYKKNGGTSWLPFRNGLPSTMVSDLKLYEGQNKIRAGTFGRGVYQSNTADGVCSTNLNTPLFLNGFHFYEASDYINSTSLIYGGFGTDVHIKAGNYIDLKEGFHAYDIGTQVRVYTGACGTGIPPLGF